MSRPDPTERHDPPLRILAEQKPDPTLHQDLARVRIEETDEQPIGNAARGIVIAFGWSILIWASLFALWAVTR